MKLLSPILDHRWFVFRYGVPTLLAESVHDLKAEGAEYAWKNELHEIFHLTARCPWTVLAEMTQQMQAAGVAVEGISSSVGDDYSSQLNLVLQHQEQIQMPASWFSQFRCDARNLTQPNAEAKAAIPVLDSFDEFRIVPNKRTVYSWIHREEITLDYQVQALPAPNPAMPVTQPGHVADLDLAHGDQEISIRPLPWPYRNYLAINSDIDWTTEQQLRELNRIVTADGGSGWGGSAFFSSESSEWVSLSGSPDTVADCAASIDTLHTWSDTIEVLRLAPSESSNRWVAKGHGRFRCLVVWLDAASSDVQADWTELEQEWADMSVSPVAAKNGKHAVVFSFGKPVDMPTGERVVRFAVTGANVTECFLCSLDPVAIRRQVAEYRQDAPRPSLFSFHGGGTLVREIAALRVGLVKDRQPDLWACDLDDPGSPFYLVPELQKLGIRYLNPRGGFLTKNLTPIDELLSPLTLDDGSQFLTFRRFLTKRHEELGLPALWRQEKSAAHPDALEFILSDLLQRFAHSEPGTGAIVYTHLGHKWGNQLTDGLAWPHHFRVWLDEVARLREQEASVWFASAREILRFADMRRTVQATVKAGSTGSGVEAHFSLPSERVDSGSLRGLTFGLKGRTDDVSVFLNGEVYTPGWRSIPEHSLVQCL